MTAPHSPATTTRSSTTSPLTTSFPTAMVARTNSPMATTMASGASPRTVTAMTARASCRTVTTMTASVNFWTARTHSLTGLALSPMSRRAARMFAGAGRLADGMGRSGVCAGR